MNWSEYLFFLLHRIFKRGIRKGSDADKLTQALGPEYAAAQESIYLLREQAKVLTATGKGLDMCGKDRKMPRFAGEKDEAYQRRLLKAYSYYQSIGRISTTESALRALGYEDVTIYPFYPIDPTRWSQFYLVFNLPAGGTLNETDWLVIYKTINKMKPSHERLGSIDVTVAAGETVNWNEVVTLNIYACPLPAENLYPSEDLYPC